MDPSTELLARAAGGRHRSLCFKHNLSRVGNAITNEYCIINDYFCLFIIVVYLLCFLCVCVYCIVHIKYENADSRVCVFGTYSQRVWPMAFTASP